MPWQRFRIRVRRRTVERLRLFRDLNKETRRSSFTCCYRSEMHSSIKRCWGEVNLSIKQKKLVGNDRIELFAFIDRKKPAGTEWSFLAPADVIKAICSQGIKPAARGDRQILSATDLP
jgi:hypothetical protein